MPLSCLRPASRNSTPASEPPTVRTTSDTSISPSLRPVGDAGGLVAAARGKVGGAFDVGEEDGDAAFR